MNYRMLVLVALFAVMPVAVAQEHPEHPVRTDWDAIEQQAAPRQRAWSARDLERAIKADVARRSKPAQGVFKLADPVLGTTWDLKLDKVHRERLTKISPDTYFACVDMKDPEGRVIDVDFFLKAKGRGLQMVGITVHKIDGKPRYDWKEEEGFWKRIPVEEQPPSD